MATRRARLQIKPNLGPRDPTKQANKTISSVVKEIFNESEKITSSDRNEHKEISAPADVSEGCIIKTRSVEAGVENTPPVANCSVSGTDETNCLISESKNETATDQIKDKNEHSKIEHSKTDTNASNGTGIVVVPYLFGKVNIPNLKSNVQESKTLEKTNDKVPVDNNNQTSGTSLAVISSSVQTSSLSITNVTEVSNKIVGQVEASDTQKEIAETFIAESTQRQPQNTDTVNFSKIKNETENLTKLIDKSVSEIVLEKPNDVRPESEKSAPWITMQQFPKVNVVNARPRIRLPKVKPNIAAAVRRPNKNVVADKTAESKEGPVLEARYCTQFSFRKEPVSPPQSQSMIPTPISLQCMPQTMTPSPVPPQLMSPVNRLPVKHWTPVLNQSPVKNSVDKRTKTASISEPPPKKKKQPVIVAPTDQPPDRTKMRMKDMIYWNPSSNPMKSKEKATVEVKDTENKKENKVTKPVVEEVEEEEEGVEDALMNEDSNGSSALPVPQVTIGPDGSIIINEQSLIVDQKDQLPQEERGVIDETDFFTTYHSYRKQNQSKTWSAKETAKFYKALGLVGIDFFLIGKLFPTRKHFELKKKFLKEDRTNKQLIDKVLKEGGQFNMAVFEKLDADDREEEKQTNQRKEKKETSKERKLKKLLEKQKEEKKSKRKTQHKRNRSKNTCINYFEDSDSEIEEARTARNKSQLCIILLVLYYITPHNSTSACYYIIYMICNKTASHSNISNTLKLKSLEEKSHKLNLIFPYHCYFYHLFLGDIMGKIMMGVSEN
ncbi:hypothetical protein ACJMK2_020159 [Sinanodonta woodiana]|uniref:Myb-like domain-containing protein n=1 Tax=Sinanodonta woodiana TaxID=1069815 RepID=A0ABD3U0R0_SINWO